MMSTNKVPRGFPLPLLFLMAGLAIGRILPLPREFGLDEDERSPSYAEIVGVDEYHEREIADGRYISCFYPHQVATGIWRLWQQGWIPDPGQRQRQTVSWVLRSLDQLLLDAGRDSFSIEEWAKQCALSTRTMRKYVSWMIDVGMLLVMPLEDGDIFYVPLLAPVDLLAEMVDGEMVDLITTGPNGDHRWNEGRWGGPMWVERTGPRPLPPRDVISSGCAPTSPAPDASPEVMSIGDAAELFLTIHAGERSRPPPHIERTRLAHWRNVFAMAGTELLVDRDAPVVAEIDRWRMALERLK